MRFLRLPDRDVFVVGNGGIETHPDRGREKLNLPDMVPNLSYLDAEGSLLEQLGLDENWHHNSIRHLACDSTGQLAFAMQWQGEVWDAPSLLGLHRMGEDARFCEAPEGTHMAMQGYAGSVSYAGGEDWVAISSPRGGLVQRFDASSGAFIEAIRAADVCGIRGSGGGMLATTGNGRVFGIGTDVATQHQMAFDNHLVAL